MPRRFKTMKPAASVSETPSARLRVARPRAIRHARSASGSQRVAAGAGTTTASRFTGGAVLGDRIRMQAHALGPGVFIRSMATRGSLGGLARATGDTIKLLAAAGYAWVLVETVSVGQTELDIMELADTTVVVLVPESGDAIQTMKAGLMEAADVFLVNKADRSGAPALMAELKFAAHLHSTSAVSPKDIDWEFPVLSAEAQNSVGIAELLVEVKRHRATLEAAGV